MQQNDSSANSGIAEKGVEIIQTVTGFEVTILQQKRALASRVSNVETSISIS